MAEPALLDHFDLRHYPPHLFDPDLRLADDDLPLGTFAGDDCDGLDFDLPADFSVDDFLLRSPDRSDSAEGSAAGSGPTPSSPSPTASGTGSAVADAASCEVKHEDSDEGSRGAAASAPNWTLKRKQPSPAASSDAAGTKCRRRSGETSLSPSASASRAAADSDDGGTAAVGDGDDTRRAARLIRNRESAQLSRQRKKRYVEELEEKVKSMNSVINDLNSRISFVAAENATLRQQLGGGPPPGVYPPGAIPGMHFPWVPGYALRPHGSHVPLVPIPRLKPQQQPAAAAAKVTKKGSDTKKTADSCKSKSKTKTKKVASVSIIGLMFVMLIFGAFVPGFNHSFGMRGRSDGAMLRNFDEQPHYRVVSVSNNHGNKVPKGGLNSSDMPGGDSGAVMETEDSAEQKHRAPLNSSETLPALLYVPRNGKHVKINGNLIIHSVLASEKAVAHKTSSKHNSDQSGVDHRETSLAIARHLSLPGNDMNPQEKSPVDGPLPQWFREGMAGPILNSGMCSEVFQFDISTASTNSAGIIPASPSVNSSSVNATRPIPAPVYSKLKNRRIMYNEAIPLTGKTVNNTEPLNRTSESSKLPDKKPASSVVVSVLADPREVGDGDSDPRMSPKSLSRIFVVVLLDGVRYVTYSCTLPFKSSSPHLVN